LDEFRLFLGDPGLKDSNLFVFGIAGLPSSLTDGWAECPICLVENLYDPEIDLTGVKFGTRQPSR
jgi:hypothetical protein